MATTIRRHRLIVVLRRVVPREAALVLVDQLAEAGARVFEITFDTPEAGDELAAVKHRLSIRTDGPYLVGAGTVTRRQQLEAARRAGADFGVAPLFDETIVDTAVSEGLPFIPGAFTPTEVAAAWAAGATFIQVFPASAVGPAFVRELRGPMPEVQLIPAGGVDSSSAPAFLDAGAAAVAIGSAITKAGAPARRALIEAIAAAGGG